MLELPVSRETAIANLQYDFSRMLFATLSQIRHRVASSTGNLEMSIAFLTFLPPTRAWTYFKWKTDWNEGGISTDWNEGGISDWNEGGISRKLQILLRSNTLLRSVTVVCNQSVL